MKFKRIFSSLTYELYPQMIGRRSARRCAFVGSSIYCESASARMMLIVEGMEEEHTMATNMAAKRAKKAQRRKQVVAQKRQLAASESGLASRAIRAATMPIQHCLLSESIFECGMGTLIVARGLSASHVTLSMFLLDTYCLGIKDVLLRSMAGAEFDMFLAKAGMASPLGPVDPSYARKLLRELAAWAQSLGFSPHRDFAAAEQIFGDVSADAGGATFQFGREGRPIYISGPSDTPSRMHHIVEKLKNALADKMLALDEPDDPPLEKSADAA
jgi:hypothetical protein